MENVEWRADETYNVHVNVHSRFLQSKGGVVPGDLFVGVSDGERVVGVLRATPTAAARSWAVPFTATAGERSLAPQSVVLAETAAAACGAQGCVRASSESFELFAHVGERVSLVASSADNEAGGIEFSDDLRAAGRLSIVLYAASPLAAYELGAVSVRVYAADASAARGGLPAFATPAAFRAAASDERAAWLLPAVALHDESGAEATPAVFAADRARQLSDECALAFDAVRPTAGVAYTGLVSVPLVPAGTLRADKHYVLRVSVSAEALTPRNTLLVGVADGVQSGARIAGFARGDASTSTLGAAVGGLLARNSQLLQLEARQYAAVPGGAAGKRGAQFELDVLLGGGAVRVSARAPRSPGAAPADAFVDAERFALDVSQPLYLVVMQHGERTAEASALRLLAATLSEVRVGCDGVAESGVELDACGVCGGDNACVGCDGVPHSGLLLDVCGVCDGDGSSCLDCAGTPNGDAVVDRCGVCGGHNACEAGRSVERAAAHKSALADSAVAHQLGKRAVSDGETPLTVKDAVDCAGVPRREGGGLMYDACGVCGGE